MAGSLEGGAGGRFRPLGAASSVEGTRGLLGGLTGRGGDLEPSPGEELDEDEVRVVVPLRPAVGRVGERLPLADGRFREREPPSRLVAAFPRCVGPAGESERRLPSRVTSLVVCGLGRGSRPLTAPRVRDPDPDRSREVDGEEESSSGTLVGMRFGCLSGAEPGGGRRASERAK